jgi:hypothetical protein
MNKDKFYFSKNDPTRFNLRKHLLLNGYVEVGHTESADFSDENIGVNDISLQNLEYKHLLANLLQRHDLNFSPLTFHINDYNFAHVLTVLQQEYSAYDGLWIYKPATLNNGEGIKLFSHIDQIIQHYQTLNRLGGDFVIQRYIDNPHLLSGHKYTIRMYVILSNYAGYKLYEHGYYNVGLQKYPGKNAVENLAAHLTNEHLTEPLPNVVQMPTSKVPEFSLLMPKIRSIVNTTIEAFSASVPEYFTPSNIRAFDILGFDFLLDEQMTLWLIEVNHGPWFPTTEPHNLQSHLYEQFWVFVVNEFVKYDQLL